jgi:hypothetical protein
LDVKVAGAAAMAGILVLAVALVRGVAVIEAADLPALGVWVAGDGDGARRSA